jgi:hypothetical protein
MFVRWKYETLQAMYVQEYFGVEMPDARLIAPI